MTADPGASRLLDDFFRRQYSTCVARLTRVLGRDNLDLAESAVQEALTRAVRVWPLSGVPDDPAAWVLRVAHRHAIDVCRRTATARALEPKLRASLRTTTSAQTPRRFDGELKDDTLAMMFMCCHPGLSRPVRVALTLKVVGGFGVDEIAGAFFSNPATVAQRIVRAKRRLRAIDARFEIPPPDELAERLGGVLDVLYLMFNEGYSCRDTDAVLQRDVVTEALRLIDMLADHPTCAAPRVHALAALMYLQSSRLEARVSDDGSLLPLAAQDRARWDDARVAQGLFFLERAATGEVLTEFHLLAGIAACHATAPDYASTPWPRILSLYDELLAINNSFVIQLNRAIAHARVHGPEAGLALIDALAERKAMGDYHLLAAARADCLERMGRRGDARAHYARAASLAPTDPERRYFMSRLERLTPRRSR